MTSQTMKSVLAAAIAIGLISSPAMAKASYPDKPITILVPFSAGGNVDLSTRIVVNSMTSELGQSIVVQNRPGAGGLIAYEAVAKASPDGYTLGTMAASSLIVTPRLLGRKDLPLTSFSAIGAISESPMVLVVPASSPYKTAKDFLQAAKQKPNMLTIGHSGNGTTGHVAILSLEKAADIDLNVIPYKGAAPALVDLIGEQLNSAIDQVTSSLPHIRGGKLHALLRALLVDGPELGLIRQAARRHDMFVSIGFNERSPVSVGCLWNSNVFIGNDGSILNHHRKLVPTSFEKLVYANGDGAGLRVSDTEIGRIGMLICGENTNPLARYALMADGEQVHICTYPAITSARTPDGKGAYDLQSGIRIRAAGHAFEAKAYNIVASTFYDSTQRACLEPLGEQMLARFDAGSRTVSMIIDPKGESIAEELSTEEGLVIAEIDLSLAVELKRLHDVVGYYNRFDIFKLTVDRRANRPVAFIDDSLGAAGDGGSPRERGDHNFAPSQNARAAASPLGS